MRPNPSRLRLAIQLLAGGTSLAFAGMAAAQSSSTTQPEVREIVVTALGIDENATLVAAPFNVLSAEEVLQRGGTLGDMLNGLPGVHSDNFGGGASRPVIRGQTSPRLQVLSDSSAVFDASTVSPDHAVTVDPLLVRRVEVLRGPATLLYGGGAIGGVVNVLDDKIPTQLPENRLQTTLGMRGNTVANERAGALGVTAQATDNLVLRFEGSLRDANDYKAPGLGHGERRVDGTFAESQNASLGASWVGEKGYIGLAYSYRSDEYGLPGHNHEYEDCHPHGSSLHCSGHDSHDHGHDSHGHNSHGHDSHGHDSHGHDSHGHDSHGHDSHGHDHHHAHAPPWVDLRSERIDLRAQINDPLPGIHRLRVRANNTDYRHYEIEDGEIGTTFTNKGYEGRVEMDHAEIAGWHGVVGVHFSDTTFSSLGLEAFVPETDTRMASLFAVEHYQVSDDFHVELGARYENVRHRVVNDPRNRPSYDNNTFSYSGALIWELSDELTTALTYARAQRVPHAQELYARGVHLATNTFECGLVDHPLTCGGVENNAPIRKETSDNIDLTLTRHSGDFTYTVNLFYNEIDNYIFARTLDQYEDFRLIKYTQSDARFRGVEAEVSYRFTDVLSATVFGDYVRATAEGNLPRISPRRVGGRLDAALMGLNSSLEFFRVSQQNQIAAFETATPGYEMLNLTLSYDVRGDGRLNVFMRGTNLLNEEVFNHTSFLANVIPMPGRNLSVGFRAQY